MKFDKTKVYTAVNAGEVKIGSKGYAADNLNTLKDVVGDENQLRIIAEIRNEKDQCRFGAIYSSGLACFNYFALFYLVEEPQKEQYRPYENTDEVIEDFKNRFGTNVPSYAEPLIWIKRKEDETKHLITNFDVNYTADDKALPCVASGTYFIYFDNLLKYYTYLDGSPCGIKI